MKSRETAAVKLEAAMKRLLNGNPIHANRQLIKENLYKEAQVSRATMNRHKEILRRFDTAIALKHDADVKSPSRVASIERQAAELSSALSKTRRSLEEAQARVRASATVISVLHAENSVLKEQLKAHRKATVTGLRSNR